MEPNQDQGKSTSSEKKEEATNPHMVTDEINLGQRQLVHDSEKILVSEQHSFTETASKEHLPSSVQRSMAPGHAKQSFSCSGQAVLDYRAKSTESSKAKLEQVQKNAAALLGDSLGMPIHHRNSMKSKDDDLLSSNYKLSKHSYNQSKEVLNPKFTRSLLKKEGAN